MTGGRPVRGWEWARGTIAFQPAFFDFTRGIRVGNLEPNQRITRILKAALETRFAEPFVTERWGRGVYWQWIGFLARANRAAKPLSNDVSFGCSKFFVSLETGEQRVKCGMQVERGYLRAPADLRRCRLGPDWDWHRLVAGLTPRGRLAAELRRLAEEGFEFHVGSWQDARLVAGRLPKMPCLRRLLEDAPAREWAGFQAYYALEERDVRAASGQELVEAMLAAFDEVTALMSLCSQIPLGSDPRP